MKTASHPQFIHCPWCGVANPWGAHECRRCGGPQPATQVEDPGPNPPSPPRSLSRGYGKQLFLTNVVGIVGLIFMVLGIPLFFVFFILAIALQDWTSFWIGSGNGALFGGIGFVMLVFALARIRQKQEIYRYGLAAIGAVTEMGLDYSMAVNGRNPWKVVYTYRVMGQPFSGQALTWHATVEVGSPLHVLYRADDPTQSVLYPPLSARRP